MSDLACLVVDNIKIVFVMVHYVFLTNTIF